MKDTLTALVIEERKGDYLALLDCLEAQAEWEIETHWANTYELGVDYFKSLEVDICFLDSHLGDGIGKDFLAELKGIKDHIPIILIGTRARIHDLDGHDGVDDFIDRKNLSEAVVAKSIKYGIDTYKQLSLLRIQKEKYGNLFYNSHEAIFTANEAYKIIEYNNSFKQLIKIDNINDFDFRNMLIDQDYENLFHAVSSATGKNIKRTKIKNGNGEILEVYISISSIVFSDDDTRFQGVIHDITELEKIATENAETEKLKLISRMARILGHEVRNPLSNIMLATEELKVDINENEDAKMLLSLVHRNALRISTLIDNFLNNTRTSALELVDLYIEEVLESAVENCKDRISLFKIHFEYNGFDKKTKIYADADKLVIAFTNIIINAVEALEETTTPKLIIQLAIEKNYVNVSIEDNGIGMTDEVKEKLFTPFYSSKQGGLGLGMANTKNIFDMHKAKVEVESESNVGTRFNIQFTLN